MAASYETSLISSEVECMGLVADVNFKIVE